MAMLIFGCGYLGGRVARGCLAAGEEVAIASRSPRRANAWADVGCRTVVADVTEQTTLVELPAAETLLYAVGYDRNSHHSIFEVYAEGLRRVLAALPVKPKQIVYISSTGVYDQQSGDWVNEQSPTEPTREGGRASLAAEKELVGASCTAQCTVLRMGGIYGPDRIPHQSLIVRGEGIPVPSQGYLNLIHVDDAVAVVRRVAETTGPSRTYCVTDGHPVLRSEYYHELARLLGAPEPTFVVPESSSGAVRRGQSSKRVSNRRLLAELGVSLRYPSYRHGLAAILSGC